MRKLPAHTRPLLIFDVFAVCCLVLRVHSLTAVSTKLTASRCFVGFDLGTSGARISVIQQQETSSSLSPLKEIYSHAVPWSDTYDDPQAWMDAATCLLQGAVDHLNQHHPHQASSVHSICVSGTSASCLVIDSKNAGKVTRRPRMYNYDVLVPPPNGKSNSRTTADSTIHGVRAMQLLDRYAPKRHTTRSPTSSLAKLLAWNDEKPLTASETLCHQSDFIALQFMSEKKACGAAGKNHRTVTSDWHNCLKLGYDVQNLQWPKWLKDCLRDGAGLDPIKVLPSRVISPGQPIGTISSMLAQEMGLPTSTVVVGGTTDSNEAFFAAAHEDNDKSSWQPGVAVTSLGSTLAIKQLSNNYVEDATVGVYSHRFPSVLSGKRRKDTLTPGEKSVTWLVGGASNVGCAILRELSFSNQELEELSQQIDPSDESPLSYYPLTKKGERFPFADSSKEPLLEPVPRERRVFLHGILQSISTVECQGFLALAQRGSDLPATVYTAGGGSRNQMWSRMRQRRLREAFGRVASDRTNELVVRRAPNTEASFGAAILAAALQI